MQEMTLAEAIKAHEDILRELKARAEAERRAAQEAIRPVYKFTLKRQEPNSWDRIYDAEVEIYRIEGQVINKAEMEAVHNIVSEGGMNYLFNTATGSFICHIGGGTTFVTREREEEFLHDVGLLLNSYSHLKVETDITGIVDKFRTWR